VNAHDLELMYRTALVTIETLPEEQRPEAARRALVCINTQVQAEVKRRQRRHVTTRRGSGSLFDCVFEKPFELIDKLFR